MSELIAFVLPLAVAVIGIRLGRVILGKWVMAQFQFGVVFALGLAIGMLVFSQAVFFCALVGINAAGLLAWLALLWGAVELVLLAISQRTKPKQFKFKPGHLWLLLLLPVLYSWWVFGRLSTLEGTLEFDAVAFWVFKAKVLYLTQGETLAGWFHDPNLAYAHWQYPTLMPSLYALGYGAFGGVNEFINKVWPFWMVVALSMAILSLGRVWERPRPLPIAVATLFCFLPASILFIRQEGGTMGLLFYAALSCMLIVDALARNNSHFLAAGVLVLVGGAAVKLEGIVHLGVWTCLLLPVVWRRGWFKQPVLWKAASVGIACLVPYLMYRLAHPVNHPANFWWREAIATPGLMLERFPNVWFLNVFNRFFSQKFFHWGADSDGHIRWDGEWTGLDSFFNQELAVLPWLLLFLLGVSFWFKTGASRRALLYLSMAIVGVLTVLTVVITCFLTLQAADGVHHFGELISDFSSNVVGRYSYPFFVAWFLGTVLLWFPASQDDPARIGAVEKKA